MCSLVSCSLNGGRLIDLLLCVVQAYALVLLKPRFANH